jgi:hypothetical protein
MRGTLHLLPAHEFGTWQAALSTYEGHRRPSWLRYHGVTDEELDALIAGVAATLTETGLTREALAEAVALHTGAPHLRELLGSGWGALLKPVAFQGLLCFGPNQGQNVTFVRPDRWLGAWPAVSPEQALTKIVRRFLGAYGPATLDDFVRWWGAVTPPRARAALARLGAEITPVEIDGARLWMLAEHAREAAEAAPAGMVRLLPAFDPYVVGASREASPLLPAAYKERVHRPQGWVSPVLLVDGRIVGVWAHEVKGRRLLVRVEPFAEAPKWLRRAAQEEAERLAAFLGGSLELHWSP